MSKISFTAKYQFLEKLRFFHTFSYVLHILVFEGLLFNFPNWGCGPTEVNRVYLFSIFELEASMGCPNLDHRDCPELLHPWMDKEETRINSHIPVFNNAFFRRKQISNCMIFSIHGVKTWKINEVMRKEKNLNIMIQINFKLRTNMSSVSRFVFEMDKLY